MYQLSGGPSHPVCSEVPCLNSGLEMPHFCPYLGLPYSMQHNFLISPAATPHLLTHFPVDVGNVRGVVLPTLLFVLFLLLLNYVSHIFPLITSYNLSSSVYSAWTQI